MSPDASRRSDQQLERFPHRHVVVDDEHDRCLAR
jgi:hypothetical protein